MMDGQLREKLKTGVLAGLLLLSIVQVGIHWNRQVQGHPLRLSLAFFQSDTQTYVDERLLSVRKTKYLEPSRIVVSDEASFRWLLDAAGPVWQSFWTDFQQHYLPLLVTEKPDRRQPRATWEQLLSSRRFVLLDFANPIPAELLPWVGNVQNVRNGYPSDTFAGIEQIAIIPTENVNATMMTMFVLADDGVYRYSFSVPSGALPKNAYVLDQEALDVDGNRQLALISAKYGLNTVRKDMMVIDDEVALSLPVLEAVFPAAIPETFAADNLQPMQESLLLNRKDSLLTRLNAEAGEVTFSDTENVFRVTTNGLFSYRHLPGTGGAGAPEADLALAFRQAVAFVDERNRLLGDTAMGLTSITPVTEKDLRQASDMNVAGTTSGPPFGLARQRFADVSDQDVAGAQSVQAYLFRFTYRVNDQWLEAMDGPNGQPFAPITVVAVSDRVIACDWWIRDIRPVSVLPWNVFFFDMYNEAVIRYPSLIAADTSLTDIRIGYRFPVLPDGEMLVPQWQLTTQTGVLSLPMRREGE